MGFKDSFNSLKDRIMGNQGDDYYDDDEYYDDGYDEGGSGYDDRPREVGTHATLLGNTPRPEAESVSVYTRSGRQVASNAGGRGYEGGSGGYGGSGYGNADKTQQFQVVSSPTAPAPVASYTQSAPVQPAPVQQVPAPAPPRPYQSQLPAYVLRPVAYDDVQTVVRRVRTNQPVVLVFKNTNIECAKRILDFSFGFSYGVNGEVKEVGDRVFAVLPQGVDLADSDLAKLYADGDLTR